MKDHSTHFPMMLLVQNAIPIDCWNRMSQQEQAEYLHVLVRAMDNAHLGSPRNSLGATILNRSVATAYNDRSSKGNESAQPWNVLLSENYNSESDPALAVDLYCFQHFAEKLLDVAGEANSASDICQPNTETPQLYNRDGMLGVRTQGLLENYARSGGEKLGPNTTIPADSPIHALAKKLLGLSWDGLDQAENDFANKVQVSLPVPSPASDVDPVWVDYYQDKGRGDLVGGKTDPKKDAEFDKTDKSGDKDSSSKVPLSTILLLGGGVALLGTALYLNRSK